MRSLAAALALLLCCALTPAGARAEGGDEARAAYDDAVAEYDLGHYKEALALFEKAFKLRHVPALLFNIAQSHRMLGELKEAAAVYRSFISRDPDSKGVAQAKELLAQVEKVLAQQEQARFAPPTDSQFDAAPGKPQPGLPPATPSASVTLSPPKPAAPVAHDPPIVLVTAQPEQPQPPQKRAPAAAVAPPQRDPPGASKPRVWTWVALGTAVAATGAGAAFGAKSGSARSSLQSDPHSAAEAASLQQGQADDAKKANLLFIAGGVLAATTAALFFLE